MHNDKASSTGVQDNVLLVHTSRGRILMNVCSSSSNGIAQSALTSIHRICLLLLLITAKVTTAAMFCLPGKRGLKVVLDSTCCTSPVPSLAACIANPSLCKHTFTQTGSAHAQIPEATTHSNKQGVSRL